MRVDNTVPVVWNPVRDSKRGRSAPGGTNRGVAVSSLWPLAFSRPSTVCRQAIVWERLRQTGEPPLNGMETKPTRRTRNGVRCQHCAYKGHNRASGGSRASAAVTSRSTAPSEWHLSRLHRVTTPRLRAGFDCEIIPLSSTEAEQARSRHATERSRGCGVQPSALHGNQTTPPSVRHDGPALCLHLVRDQKCDAGYDARGMTSIACAANRDSE